MKRPVGTRSHPAKDAMSDFPYELQKGTQPWSLPTLNSAANNTFVRGLRPRRVKKGTKHPLTGKSCGIMEMNQGAC